MIEISSPAGFHLNSYALLSLMADRGGAPPSAADWSNVEKTLEYLT